MEAQQSLITNFGDNTKIRGVHNSLATGDRQALTYLENFTVKRLYRDTSLPKSPVIIEKLMYLSLSPYDSYDDAYVLDGVVAVRVNNTAFEFFLMPLVESLAVTPIMKAPVDPEDLLDNKPSFDYAELMSYGFAPNKKDTNYVLFGLRSSQLVKIKYSLSTFDNGDVWISDEVLIKEDTNFNGTHMRLHVTEDFIIVSNPDGLVPSISFFDHDWTLIKNFTRYRQEEAPYNLEVYAVPEFELVQVFVAGNNTVTIIEAAKNEKGEIFFNMLSDVYEAPAEQPFSSDQTYVAKSGDYLVIKQSSKRNLVLLPLCSLKYVFHEESFTCRPCERGLKSYGL